MAQAVNFAPPELLDLSEDQKEDILETIFHLYRDRVEERGKWTKQHVGYDEMFRGQVDSNRAGPWKGSSNLHVQMPYWLVDSINTRLVTGIWSQTPLVSGKAEEDDDQEIFRDACKLVDWHLQPKRMNARAMWSKISKMRCIHGAGVGLISYAFDEYTYRALEETASPALLFNPDGTPMIDDDGQPVIQSAKETTLKRAVRYDGPVLFPLEWDDLIKSKEGFNLQPLTESNPGGSDFVGLRTFQNLSLIWQLKDSSYGYIDDDDDMKKRDWWIDNAPSQDRSGDAITSDNQQRVKTQDRHEGMQRSLSTRRTPTIRPNPEFEVLRWFMPWPLENEEGEEEWTECVFFAATAPRKLIGAYRLSDIYWQDERPLLEMHYQTVGTRWYSMGVMEIAKHLSAELDTIHNMRMDVGFATNMPFFFYRATSTINPEKIQLRPLKGVPVDDINDVRFPQLQNVTSFYNQEEQLLYTLVERVMGVTDLFLGMSPTRGAASRHATGFVGTQQESMARMGETSSQDAEAFSFLCRTIYNMELQFGPEERSLRLQGKEGPLTQQLSRKEMWMRGEYDFRIGANAGLYGSMMRQEQAQTLSQLAANSPIIMQDPAKMWEVLNFALHSVDIQNPEQFIGPKEALSAGVPKDADEENGEMDQQIFGPGQGAVVHPNDNDDRHIQEHMAHIQSSAFQSMNEPNMAGHMMHLQQQVQQKQQKATMQQQQAATAAAGGGQPPQQGQQQPTAANVAQLDGAQQGAMGNVGASPAANNGAANGAANSAMPNLTGAGV